MSATSALQAVAAPAANVGALRAEPASAAGATDFAGLIGLAVAAPAAPVAAADELVDSENATDGDETDVATDATPPLLNWLFGLMAATGASMPAAGAAADFADAAPVDPQTSPQIGPMAATGATLPAVDGADPALPGPATPPVAADVSWAAAPPLQAGAPAVPPPPLPAAADLGKQLMSAAAAKAPPRAAVSQPTDATPIATDPVAVDTAIEPAPLALDAQPLADALLAAEPPPAMADAADLLRDAAHARPAHAFESALQSPLPAVHGPRLSPGAADAASAAFAGGILNAMADDFVADLGERIEWQLAGGIGEAKIELHPAELGALTVRIETQGDQARVHIVAAEAATRSLLNQAMPQLRELFAASGMNLARSQVDSSDRREGRAAERAGAAQATLGARRRVTQLLLVDAYA